MKTKYETFLQCNTKFFSSESSVSPTFWILPKLYELCKSCRRNSLETLYIRFWSTGEPSICEYVTLLQSFYRGALSIHWYIAQNLHPTFSMSVLFRRLFRTAILSRFSKVAIAMSNIMNEFFNDIFLPEFSVSLLKEIIALVRDYVSETRK